MKKIIITIDTEEDNQWSSKSLSTTDNAKYIHRFQELCNTYLFKPVYLSTYSMVKDKNFILFAKESLAEKNCEIGMHLHAWCSPPHFKLNGNKNNRSYLIEYPTEIMEEKIKCITECIEDTFMEKVVSHRSGRWTLNEQYIHLLDKYGYLCDCSVTPGVNWSKNLGELGTAGSDYSNAPHYPYMISDNIIEIPVTIGHPRYFDMKSINSFKTLVREGYHLLKGKQTWIRPSNSSLHQMKKMVKQVKNSDIDYIMFMLHSSEFMPDGSPYYKTEKDIELLFTVLNELFMFLSDDYQGITLKDYQQELRNGMIGALK